MLGLMQQPPLMISGLLRHAARHHPRAEIASVVAEQTLHRYNYPEAERRARRLAGALAALGVCDGDRVGTLAWNGFRHFELYYAVSGMGAVVHTVNPRLHEDDIAYIINHAGDRLLFADVSFVPLVSAIAPKIAATVSTIVFMTDPAGMPAIELPEGIRAICYETLMEEADDSFAWPEFDENTAGVLCYTSGTTGRPKGVLYSHRSTVLHALMLNARDSFGLCASEIVLPAVPMFHVNAWGTPFGGPLAGATLVMPGRYLDGPSLEWLINQESVTFSLGVPTIWMGLLAHLRATGARIPTLKRIVTGGSACPSMLLEGFEREYGIEVIHAWGMTEVSPLGTVCTLKPFHATLQEPERARVRLTQGRALPMVDFKIVDDSGTELPWDGKQFGDLMVRGPWVCSAYLGDKPGSGTDAEGWFATGDVATIDPDGYMEITDRSKDVIKSGGEWISSIVLENIAVSHPDVVEAAVVASRHPKWDERPLLLIVPRAGATVTIADLLPLYEGKAPRWWYPDAMVTVDALPHTATGKLLKTALRRDYEDFYLRSGG